MRAFKSFVGVDCDNRPAVITAKDLDPIGDLFERIQAMPKAKPVSLQRAWALMQEDFLHTLFETQDFAATTASLERHWVEHVSKLGYQIVLNGSEFETAAAA